MELLDQLGINWKLLLSQAVNFFVLLLVLTFFVYKPLIQIIKERNKKIKEGLDKAEEADIRLKEADGIAKGKIKEAEQESVGIVKETERKAKILEESLVKKAEEKQGQMMKDSEEMLKRQLEENKKIVLEKAADLVRAAIVKTVELKPEEVDEALIKKAINEIQG